MVPECDYREPEKPVPPSDKQDLTVDQAEEERATISVEKRFIPKGARLVEAYISETGEIIVVGEPNPEDENHNCDEMGCSTFSHVIYRALISRPAKPVSVTREWVKDISETLSAIRRIPMTMERQIAVVEGNEAYLRRKLREKGVEVKP